MSSKSSKGSRLEYLLQQLLQNDGWKIHRSRKNIIMTSMCINYGKSCFMKVCNKHPRKIVAQRNDLFGCFDFICKHPDFPHLTVYFQVSSEWKYRKSLNEMKQNFVYGPVDLVFLVRKQTRKAFEFREVLHNFTLTDAILTYEQFKKRCQEFPKITLTIK